MRRVFLFLLLAGLVTGVSCARRAATTGVSVDPAFRHLIPPDTRVLASVDLEKLKNAAFYRRHESQLDFPLLDAASERIGLDPRRDIADLLIAWNGKRPVFLVRGRFTRSVIEQKLVAQGARRTAYRRYTLIGDQENSLVFLKKAVAAGGSSAAVRAVIDLEANHQGAVPEELQDRLRAVPKGDQIWIVSRGGLPFSDLPMRSDYESALSNIVGYVRGTSIGTGVDTGVHLTADLACISPQGAQRVGDGLRAAVALGRLTTKDDQQDLLRMYDAIRVNQDKEMVQVRADFPGDLADKLLAYVLELRSSAGMLNH